MGVSSKWLVVSEHVARRFDPSRRLPSDARNFRVVSAELLIPEDSEVGTHPQSGEPGKPCVCLIDLYKCSDGNDFIKASTIVLRSKHRLLFNENTPSLKTVTCSFWSMKTATDLQEDPLKSAREWTGFRAASGETDAIEGWPGA